MEIANSNDRKEIEFDWRYLEEHAVPQLDQAIDAGKFLTTNSDALLQIVLKAVRFIP